MHISIWQQWASNHSGGFELVGVFKSVEAADKAADALRGILTTIARWYERPENVHLALRCRLGEDLPPSPPEIDFSQQYGVEWNECSVNWLCQYDIAREVVYTLDNLVFISSVVAETWLGPKPFDELIGKLDGYVHGIVEGETGSFSVAVSCLAPDEHIAQRIHDDCLECFSDPLCDPIPWADNENKENLALLVGETTQQERGRAWNWFQTLMQARHRALQRATTDPRFLELHDKMQQAVHKQDVQYLNELSTDYQRLMESIPEIAAVQEAMSSDDPAIRRQILLVSHMSPDSTLAIDDGSIIRDGVRLQFQDLVLLDIQVSLPAFLAYLKNQGCTNIEYTFEIERWGE